MRKIKLKAIQRQKTIVRTAKKEFDTYYLEDVFSGPIIEVDEETEIELHEFFKTFNQWQDLDWLQLSYEDVHLNGGQEDG